MLRPLLAVLMILPSLAAAQPRRVLSLNLCTDQLVLALAQPGDIAGLTRLASDCAISIACKAAAEQRTVRGTAEEVIALQPDLVVGGRYTARPAMQAARRLGVPVLEMEPANSLAVIREQITTVAAALGQVERGSALVAAFDRRLANIPPPPDRRRVAAIYQANGFTVGQTSLAGDILLRAGLDNFSVREGVDRYSVLPMEVLVWRHPDLLITDAPSPRASQATALLQHPLLAEAFAGRRVIVPSRLWICGLPETLDAVALLAAEARR